MRVSCIMPTYNRRKTIPLALKCFLSQDWKDKELVVIDDGESVKDLFKGIKKVFYRSSEERISLGAKKNLACEIATGEVIVHWDDDDWSSPTRISEQVARLKSSGKPVTGYCNLVFWNTTKKSASKYYGDRNYSCDSALCYRKEYWSENKFRESLGTREDHDFAYKAGRSGKMESVDGGTSLIAVTHPGNTSKDPRSFPVVDISEIPAQFIEDIACIG